MRLLLVLLPLLAGCLAPPEAAPPDAPVVEPVVAAEPVAAARPEAPAAANLTLAGCTVVTATARLPIERLQPHVPKPFEAAAEHGQGTLSLRGFDCEEGGAFSSLAIAVRPRHPDLQREDLMLYSWRVETHLVAGTPLAALLREMGASDAVEARVRVEPGPPRVALDVEAGDVRHRASAAPGSLIPPTPGTFHPGWREYSMAEGGFAYLELSLVEPGPGPTYAMLPCVLEPGAGTVARELLGERAPCLATLLADAVLTEARVGFAPAPQPPA